MRSHRSFFVACAALLVALVLSGLGCNSSELASGVAPCTTDAQCPSNYHCAVDLTCWRNGSDPTIDGSLLDSSTVVTCTGKTACGGACVDLQTAHDNCGICGDACASAQVCSRGTCALSCGGGTTHCGDICSDTRNDPQNCGTCEAACAAGLVCAGGTCRASCLSGELKCGDVCVDPRSSPDFCGATAGCGSDGGSAGMVCPSGNVCANGVCAVSCPGSEINCGGTCVDPESSLSNCGATTGCGTSGGSAGTTCANGNVCANGVCAVSCPGTQINCAGVCVDPQTSLRNCGATSGCGADGGSAGTACASGMVCSGGSCGVSCAATEVYCGGVCVDPLTSRANCGATAGCGADGGTAGTTCANGNVCANGVCAVSCPGTEINCAGGCIDPETSLTNCGATAGCGADGGVPGNACANGNVCANGACAVSCPGSQVNCGGTCINPQTSRAHCGASADCSADAGTSGVACLNGNVCANGSCAVSCPGSQIVCGGECVDPSTSLSNCGATSGCGSSGGSAGTPCANGNVCANGACAVSCPGTQINCGGTCVDPKTSLTNCGATAGCGVDGGSSGIACANGNVCANGACGVSCPGTEINCGGACIDPQTSLTNCGATSGCGVDAGAPGTACASGNVCANGSCAVACPGSQINCNGTCIDPATSLTNCGATDGCGADGGISGTTCANGNVCANGACSVSCPGSQINCGGVCVDPNTSRTNCGANGACGVDGGSPGASCASGTVCANGSCQISCAAPEIECNGSCIDPSTSRTNCGATVGCGVVADGGSPDAGSAGSACASGYVCSDGSCQVSCPSSEINCGGTCIDRLTSPTNCGATADCSPDAGTAGEACETGTACISGSCTASCALPLVACSGACVDTNYDPAHCGGCSPCPSESNATNYCSGGVCGIAACAPGFADCDGDVSTGCEVNKATDDNNCGGCNIVCSGATPYCNNGTCIADECPRSSGAVLAFELSVPVSVDWTSDSSVAYTTDNRGSLGSTSWTRVGYCLDLDGEYAYVEMDDFSGHDLSLLGPPSQWIFDQSVNNLTVRSNVSGVPNVSNVPSGAIGTAGYMEFWPNCYGTGLNGVYDYKDDDDPGSNCYGSMQVSYATTTVIAVNSWTNNGPTDIGIGNQVGGSNQPDWTFAHNAGSYSVRTLKGYVVP